MPSLRYIYLSCFIFVMFLGSCSPTKKAPTKQNAPEITGVQAMDVNTKTDAFLEMLLKQGSPFFDSVLINRKEWNAQVVYTQVNRGKNGVPELNNYFFNVNPGRYFYPASTVKLPVCLLALQKINELKDKGIDKNTTMITEVGNSSQSAVYNDPATIDGRPTIAGYIKKILLVSDNDAYNRLYEFLGQDYINKELYKKGYPNVQILHRLQLTHSEQENRQTNPIKFLDANNKVLYEQLMQNNTTVYAARNDSMGLGYFRDDKLINSPMNFSGKNRIALEDLHQVLISLVFPEKVSVNSRFNLTEEDRLFLLKYMSQLPTESTYPPYSSDTVTYWPAYCKFLLFGSQKGEMPKNLRSFNKPGDAYGHLLDVAYIVDYDKGVEFFLSAVIYCNSDGILNDDKYDYNTIGLPFMKHLGKIIYEYELKRPKKQQPDFSNFLFEYDKK